MSTLRTSGVALASAVVGGAVVWIGQSGSFHLTPVDMSYADLAAVLLAAVGVIVTIFGGVLALAAIWGFKQLKLDAISAAVTAGSAELKTQISEGTIRDYIGKEIERLADDEFKSEQMENRIKRRVDAVVFGRPAADRLLENEGDE